MNASGLLNFAEFFHSILNLNVSDEYLLSDKGLPGVFDILRRRKGIYIVQFDIHILNKLYYTAIYGNHCSYEKKKRKIQNFIRAIFRAGYFMLG